MGSTPPPTQDSSHHQDDITFLVGNPYINLCGCYWVGGRSKHIRKYDIFGQISSRPISAGWEFPPTVVKSKGIQNALIIQVQDNAKLICPVTLLSLFKGTFPADISSIYIISHIVLQNTVIIRRWSSTKKNTPDLQVCTLTYMFMIYIYFYIHTHAYLPALIL